MKILGVAFLLGLLGAVASADTVLYAEGADMSNVGGAPTVIAAFVPGVNVIRGSLNIAAGDNQDIWSSVLGPGLVIVSGEVVVTAFSGNTTTGNVVAFSELLDSFSVPTKHIRSNFMGTGTFPLTVQAGALPFGPGTWLGRTAMSSTLGTSTTYEMRITVRSTPEPATILLFGIAGAFVIRRRRTR